jgi:type IV pilus assembly protein PilF
VALDEVKLALAADPNYADGYGMRALIYQQMGENGLAEETSCAPASWRRPARPGQQLRFLPVPAGRVKEAMPLFDAALTSRLPFAGQCREQRRFVR